ncbi:hypothetical protein NKI54_13995 [Mesorhizobium sp. M0663]|uniref:hypothetical protein n=1 Tax=Mesorhizobium sp. M0663 TaxID=2956981 RepID=UPI00333DAE5C
MASYLITYFDKTGETLEELSTSQWDHWDACEFGWGNAPKGTEDFQVTEAL